jgi:hypothetical protein
MIIIFPNHRFKRILKISLKEKSLHIIKFSLFIENNDLVFRTYICDNCIHAEIIVNFKIESVKQFSLMHELIFVNIIYKSFFLYYLTFAILKK